MLLLRPPSRHEAPTRTARPLPVREKSTQMRRGKVRGVEKLLMGNGPQVLGPVPETLRPASAQFQ